MNQKQMKLCKGYHNLVKDCYNNKIICNNCSLEFHLKNFGTYDVFVLSNKSTLENIICYKYWYEDFNENESIKINNSHSFEETEDYSICYQGNNVLYKCSNGCGTIKFFMKESSK